MDNKADYHSSTNCTMFIYLNVRQFEVNLKFMLYCNTYLFSVVFYFMTKRLSVFCRSIYFDICTDNNINFFFFFHISSSHIVNSVCWSHALVNGPTSKRPASDDGRCGGQLLMMLMIISPTWEAPSPEKPTLTWKSITDFPKPTLHLEDS